MFGASDIKPWAWLIAGLVLVGLETLAPGVFLVWLGIAAILTGLADYLFDLAWQPAFVLFAVLAIAAVIAGRALTRTRSTGQSGEGMLNRRGEALVGRRFTLDQPIQAGEGRIRVDDSVWRVLGPDLPAGEVVQVTRIEGATLMVERSPPQ